MTSRFTDVGPRRRRRRQNPTQSAPPYPGEGRQRRRRRSLLKRRAAGANHDTREPTESLAVLWPEKPWNCRPFTAPAAAGRPLDREPQDTESRAGSSSGPSSESSSGPSSESSSGPSCESSSGLSRRPAAGRLLDGEPAGLRGRELLGVHQRRERARVEVPPGPVRLLRARARCFENLSL